MKVFVDAKILQNIPESIKGDELIFGWAALLDVLGLSSLLETLPRFDESNDIYKSILQTLENENQDNLVKLYDRLFAETLTEVSSLKEIQPAFLFESMQGNRLPLGHYENILKEHPQESLHDLILYIAWDRVCVNLAIIFEHAAANAIVRRGLETLKKCLVESFQHIMEQGKTVPSFFRLMEAFFAFQMREENLQIHSDAEWLILCQGARALKSREGLPDVIYIDAAVAKEPHFIKAATMDSEEKTASGIALAKDMMRKLKQEYSGWKYVFSPVEIINIKGEQHGS